jgi:transcriptional regulator with GAF, ATPase, and Fis domain
MQQVNQVAHLKNTILLLGETGTGKEVIANAIHRLLRRGDEPFIKVNCGAIPEQLIDSELFGHEKGAFTGATQQKRGRFERANKGTISWMKSASYRRGPRFGCCACSRPRRSKGSAGSPPIRLDIRVIAATHRNLMEMVAAGRSGRTSGSGSMPFLSRSRPLHRRKGDIPVLAAYFLSKKSKELGIHPIPTMTAETLQRLPGIRGRAMSGSLKMQWSAL